MKSGQVLCPTAGGTVEILFALNNWVLVRLPAGESVQRRIGREPELAAMLRELGLPETEARKVAGEAWRQRPATAGLRDARSHESLRSAAAIPTSLLVLILAVFCALAIYALVRWLGTPA